MYRERHLYIHLSLEHHFPCQKVQALSAPRPIPNVYFNYSINWIWPQNYVSSIPSEISMPPHLKKKDLFYICEYAVAHQKRASDPITDGCEPPCCCWELNSGPLEDQSVTSTSESSLQPRRSLFKFYHYTVIMGASILYKMETQKYM